MTLLEIKELKGSLIDWVDETMIIFSKANLIFSCDHNFKNIKSLGKIPYPIYKRIFTQFQLGKRLLRSNCYNIIPVDNKTLFITFDKEIGVLQEGKWLCLNESDKYRVLRQGVAYNNQKLFWGDYVANHDRSRTINVWAYAYNEKDVKKVFSFPKGAIRHIHGIHQDPYKNSLWVTSGDKPNECKFYETTNQFAELKLQFSGDETWRCVKPIFTEDFIYYASDCEFIANYIYKVDRKTKQRTRLLKINGPCYYSTKVGDYFLFASTAELCPSQNDQLANIYSIHKDTDEIKLIFSGHKDLVFTNKVNNQPLANRIFQNGIVNFPTHSTSYNKKYTFFSAYGLKNVNYKVFKILTA